MKRALAIACLLSLGVQTQDSKEIPRWIEQLGDDDPVVRNRAEKRLIEMGIPALSAVKAAAESKDAEVRVRAERILVELEWVNIATIGGYDSRLVNKKAYLEHGGGSRETEEAVLNALRWLARHQNADGSWSVAAYKLRCGKSACTPNPGEEDLSLGVTGLALLAFLGAGYTHLSDDSFGTVVKNGLAHLKQVQDASGRIGSDNVPKYMYFHLICTVVLCEAYGMTKSNALKDPAQKAVDYTIKAQNPKQGWRYAYRADDSDSSVTGWATEALLAAEGAQLKVDRAVYQRILEWYRSATDEKSHRVGYLDSRMGKVVIPGSNEQFSDHPSLTAVALMSTIGAARKKNGVHVAAYADHLLNDLPEWDDKGLKVDFYYWFWGTYAMYRCHGPNAQGWHKWNDKIKTALLSKQNAKAGDCNCGSWEPLDRWSGQGGRVYTTALGALILEVYYRLTPLKG